MVRAIGKFVLVRPLPSANVTAGGIHLVEGWQQPSGQATVLSVGGKVQDLKPGDTIFYSWINGRDVEHEGETFRCLEQREVLGVMERPMEVTA